MSDFIRILVWLCCVLLGLELKAESYKNYSVDRQPFKRHKAEGGPLYEQLQEKFETQPLSLEEHKQRMKIIGDILLKEKDWWDGYWLLAADSFVVSSFYKEPEHFPEARRLLELGLKATELCLATQANHPLCKFFYASNLAKISAIDGIFASLKHGPKIQRLWMDVLESGFNIQFRPNSSLQGSVRYGLGLFHRVVPDLWLVSFLFKIRGNIDRSIQFHREGLALDTDDPCAKMMLATALICKNKGESKGPLFTEAKSLLENAAQQRALDFNQMICVKDSPRILAHPETSCGYTQAKFQNELTDKDFS
jgi:hypothetical protein